MKTITITDYEVDIKEALTWGDNEEITAATMGGDSRVDIRENNEDLKLNLGQGMINRKVKLVEVAVIEIRNKEGKKVEFSREWLMGLSIKDGNVIHKEAEALVKKN